MVICILWMEFIKHIKEEDPVVEERHLKQVLEYKRLLFYGIGNQFKQCYKLFKDKNVMFFDSDSQKWGKVIDQTVIHSPKEMLNYIDDNTGILVSSISNQFEIARMLVYDMGISPSRIYMYTSQWYESKIYKPDDIQKNWDRIISCSKRLADDESQMYYINSVLARQQRNPLLLMPNPKCISIGEYNDIVCLEKNDSIIDCGAYTGDTAELYMNRLNKQCRVFAIEPYKENFDKLEQRIRKCHWEDKVKAFHCAVGKTVNKATINFNKDDFNMAINLSNREGQEHQEVVIETLDHLFKERRINFIKMDIEGEERNALEGAKELIRSNHPRLLISGYHKIEDFWEIPEMIWSIDDNYKIYVGHAPGISTEVEFYCINN